MQNPSGTDISMSGIYKYGCDIDKPRFALCYWEFEVMTVGCVNTMVILFFSLKNIFKCPSRWGQPLKSGENFLSEFYVVGSLNLCLETPDLIEKNKLKRITLS